MATPDQAQQLPDLAAQATYDLQPSDPAAVTAEEAITTFVDEVRENESRPDSMSSPSTVKGEEDVIVVHLTADDLQVAMDSLRERRVGNETATGVLIAVPKDPSPQPVPINAKGERGSQVVDLRRSVGASVLFDTGLVVVTKSDYPDNYPQVGTHLRRAAQVEAASHTDRDGKPSPRVLDITPAAVRTPQVGSDGRLFTSENAPKGYKTTE